MTIKEYLKLILDVMLNTIGIDILIESESGTDMETIIDGLPKDFTTYFFCI